jgi:hypothetical protein
MRRRRSVVRWISRAVATVAVGGLLGFLVPTVIADLSPQPEVEAVVAESPVARQFITAFIADDQATLQSMGAAAEITARAARLKAEYIRIDPPVHLGSYNAGSISFHTYAAHVLTVDGAADLLSWRVISRGGRATLVLPPNPIEP